MREFLFGLAEVTLVMSVVIGALLLLERVLERRFAPQWRYWAWLAVALRLCVPFNVSLPQAPVQVEAPPAAVRVERPVSPEAGPPAVFWNTSPEAGQPGPVYRVEGDQSAFEAAVSDRSPQVVEVYRIPAEQVLFALWSVGAAVFLGIHIVSYVNFKRKVKRWSYEAGPYEGIPVWECDIIMSPMLMGLIRPVILVPAGGADSFALMHEAQHARRRDLWYKLVLVLANAIHWFDPLVWMLRRAAERDLEIACDAAVLQGRDLAFRQAYGQVLLDTVRPGRKQAGALTSAFSGSKRSLRQRVASLVDMAPRHPGRAALAVLCAVALLGGTLVACRPEQGQGEPVPMDSPAIPAGDFYDQDSGLYVSGYVKAGVMVPAELRDRIMPQHREKSKGDPVVEFLDKDGLEGAYLFAIETSGTTYHNNADGADTWGPALAESWFQADHAQLIQEEQVTDPTTGITLTFPQEAWGLILLSGRAATEQGGIAQRYGLTPPDSNGEAAWLLCIHPEMLAKLTVPDFVSGRSGVFSLALLPGAEPMWSFGWEGRYPWLTAQLSEEAQAACRAVLDGQADLQASLAVDPDHQAAGKLATQGGVTGVELLKDLPVRDGVIDYVNSEFGFSLTLPQSAAEHLAAVTVDRGSTGWKRVEDIGASAGPDATPQELEEVRRAAETAQEAIEALRSIVFVDLRLVDITEGMVDIPVWAGRVVCAGEGEEILRLDPVGEAGGYRFYAAPSLLSAESLAGYGDLDVDGIMETEAAVQSALSALRTGAEGLTLLDRFVPDGLTAFYQGVGPADDGREDTIRLFGLELDFHLRDGGDEVPAADSLSFALEFSQNSPMLDVMGGTPFGQTGLEWAGTTGSARFITGRNTMTEAYLAQKVVQGPECLLRVTDPATGRSRSFPLKASYESGGERQVVYANAWSYDRGRGELTYDPIQVDERDLTYQNPALEEVTAPVSPTVRLVNGYSQPDGDDNSIDQFLDSQVLSSHWPTCLRLTLEGGSITVMEWVWMTPPEDAVAAETRLGIVHRVDVEGLGLSGYWLDEAGEIDLDAPYELAVEEGANVQLLDSEGRYSGPVGLKGLETYRAPISSWGPVFKLSILENGKVAGIVQQKP